MINTPTIQDTGPVMSSPSAADCERGFYEKLSQAFRAGLDLPAETEVTALAFGQHRNWDSLGHMSLIATLEEMFGVSLAGTEVFAIDSYTSAAEILRPKDRVLGSGDRADS